jgi:hypothetical protein
LRSWRDIEIRGSAIKYGKSIYYSPGQEDVKMRANAAVALLACAMIPIGGCVDKSNNGAAGSGTGTIEFRTVNPLRSGLSKAGLPKSAQTNPSLVGDTTTAYTTSYMLCVGDVWVSQQEVKAGETDTLQWIRLTTTTNTQHKLFEDYTFSAIEIPAGTYKSIKITFRNLFYRYVQLASDTAIAFELLETMGSWTDTCNANDTSWARTNYFGPDGNHILDSNNVFELVSAGERLGGFSIEAGKTAIVTWRLGAGATQPCTTYLIDKNSNRVWDCGVDRMDFVCPPEVQYMWDFVVAYQ